MNDTGDSSRSDEFVALESVETVSHETERRRIDVHVTEKSPCILGDALRLAQVLENLLSNATKYSPVETAIRVGLSGSDSRLILSVWNDGGRMSVSEEGGGTTFTVELPRPAATSSEHS